jgi:succinate dehydrogenase / fumarate reductase flavoprotein subunit
MGTVVGEHLAAQRPAAPALSDGTAAYAERAMRALADLARENGSVRPATLIADLRDCMDEYAGIIRDEAGIQDGLAELRALRDRTSDLRVEGGRTGADFELAVDLSFMLTLAEGVLRGALVREESRGAHFRQGCGGPSPEWHRNVLFRCGDTGMDHYTRGVPEPSGVVQDALDEGHELDYHHLE